MSDSVTLTMSLTLRAEDLSRFCVSADLGSSDGRISLALKSGRESDPAPMVAGDVLVHFETVVEMGQRKLNVFTSVEGTSKERNSNVATSEPANISDPSGMHF